MQPFINNVHLKYTQPEQTYLAMKKLRLLLPFFCVFYLNKIVAQNTKINCDSLCVTSISMSDISKNDLTVTLYNGDSNHINYPLIKLVYNGDTVANQKEFRYYAQRGKSSLEHTIPTTFTALPENFKCKVIVIDPLWQDTCILDYPCKATSANGIKYLKSPLENINIYPNPAKQLLNIEFNAINDQPFQLKIFSTSGAEISVPASCTFYKYTLDIHSLPKGLYLLCLQGDDYTFTQKLIKE